MSTHRTRIAVGLVLAAFLAVVVAVVVRSAHDSRARPSGLLSELEARLDRSEASACKDPVTIELLDDLAAGERGRELLAELDSRRDDVAWDAGRQVLVWLRRNDPADPNSGTELNLWYPLGGYSAPYPREMKLRNARFDGKLLRVELSTCEDEEALRALEPYWRLEANRTYEGTVGTGFPGMDVIGLGALCDLRPIDK